MHLWQEAFVYKRKGGTKRGGTLRQGSAELKKKNSPLLKMGVQCNREAPPRLRTGYFKKGLAK